MEEKEIINKELKIINVGILNFYSALISQGTDAVQVNWRPPVEIDDDLDSILKKIL